jgi:Undecaprenyl-phosphate glucose phosphotransferase
VQPAAGKQLFSHPYRKRRRFKPADGRTTRLLNGQALAEAQRLSRPRLRSQVFVVTQMASDLVLILLTGLLAHVLAPDLLALDGSVVVILWVAAVTSLAATRALQGYKLWRMRSLSLSLPRAGVGLAIGMGAVLAVNAVAGRPFDGVLDWVGIWSVLALAMIFGVRILIWQRLHALTRLGVLDHRLVVVGGGERLAPTLRALDQTRREGYRICGVFDARCDARSPDVVAGHHKIGDLDDLVEFVRIAQIDTVIVAVPGLTHRRMMELMASLSPVPVEIRSLQVPGLPVPDNAPRSRIGNVDLVELSRPPIGGLKAVQKRVFDLATASLALVLLAPVMLGVAMAVRLDSRGPILFRQIRHGFNNKPVAVLKFRSMYADRCDPTAVRAVRQNDDRVTRVGKFIRRTSLDELPQLFNVLSGELSMVGPRPHATAARTGDILFDDVADAYSARHRVKPGITGWAQINGWRGEMNSEEKIKARVEHDLHYIENWSLWFDLKILARTPMALISGKNAY